MLASTGVHSNKRTQNYAFPALRPSEWGIIFMYCPHFYDVWPRQIDFWQLRQTNLAMICSANGECKIHAERLTRPPASHSRFGSLSFASPCASLLFALPPEQAKRPTPKRKVTAPPCYFATFWGSILADFAKKQHFLAKRFFCSQNVSNFALANPPRRRFPLG